MILLKQKILKLAKVIILLANYDYDLELMIYGKRQKQLRLPLEDTQNTIAYYKGYQTNLTT